ncbi:SYCP2_SLD domain-containing protein [Caerostris darwini]|uniref:SYCP2_SLD domain-containing protein n=1 Tax=Caerostris darwini TaxID=1538125 RepID=A0AAV4U6X3_9ARAC|nr:SYCP2_SLD domain-containing protein [Caerostris darwini]
MIHIENGRIPKYPDFEYINLYGKSMVSLGIDEILESAFVECNSEAVFNVWEASDTNYVTNKISDDLKSCIYSLSENEEVVVNILMIIKDLLENYELDLYQKSVLLKCMLEIIIEECVCVSILKRAVLNVNLLFNDSLVVEWLKNEASLEGSVLILGRKIPFIGDYECQTFIFEALCRFLNEDDKEKWAESWFSNNETAKYLFLNLIPAMFEVDCRKILNHVNHNESNPRVYSYVATSVYFDTLELKKPYGIDFWIDFNYDSESISFFCSEVCTEHVEPGTTWETIVVSSNQVKSWFIKNNYKLQLKELCITLNCSCKELLPESDDLYIPVKNNLVHITFQSFIDIEPHISILFGEPLNLTEKFDRGSQKNSSESQSSRKISNSVEVCPIGDYNENYTKSQNSQKISSSIDVFTVGELNDTENNRKISTSSILEEYDSEKYSQTKEKRGSDSINLINLSDTDIKEKQNKHFSMPKRKASCSSVISIESDNAANFEANSIYENTKIQGEDEAIKTISKTEKNFLLKDSEAVENLNVKQTLLQHKKKNSLQDNYNSQNTEIISNSCRKVSQSFSDMEETYMISPTQVSKKKSNKLTPISPKDCNTSKIQITTTATKDKYKISDKVTSDIKLKYKLDNLEQNKPDKCLLSNKLQKRMRLYNINKDPIYDVPPSQKKRFTDDNDVKNYSPFLNSSLTNQNRRLKNSLEQDDEEICDVKQDFIISQKQKNEFFENQQNSQLPLNNIANESCIERTECNDLENVFSEIEKTINSENKSPKEDGSDNKLHPSDKDYALSQPKRKKIKKDHNFGTESDTDVKKNKYLKRKNADAEKEDNPQQFQPEDQNFNPESDIDVKKSKHLKRKTEAEKEDSSHYNFNSESDIDVKKSKHLKRKTEAEKEDSSHQFQSKRPRKAAIKAKNRNKIILNEKHFDNVYEIYKSSPSHISNSNDEIKDWFDTPPTKPVKKKRFSRKSVFMTDTETGSSEISWFALHKTGLFETPKKKYSNRRSKPLKDASTIKKTYKSASSNKKRETRSTNFSFFEPDSKFKGVLSDLENYELVVEKNTDDKNYFTLNQRLFDSETVSKAIESALKSVIHERNSPTECHQRDSNHSNKDLRMNEEITDTNFDKPNLNYKKINQS